LFVGRRCRTTSGCRPGEKDTRGHYGRILATVRRRLLLVFLSTLPACLSGFTEIRVVRRDASISDTARLDVLAAAVDAVRPDVDAEDARSVGDPQTAPEDSSDATAESNDSGSFDAPEVLPDGVTSVDGPGPSQPDSLLPFDVVPDGDGSNAQDGGVASDACPAHYTPCSATCALLFNDRTNCGVCGSVCATSTQCVRGVCQPPTRYRGWVVVDGAAYSRDPRALDAWDTLCRNRFGGRLCSARELDGFGFGFSLCREIGRLDGGRSYAAIYLPAPFFTVEDAGTISFSTATCIGRVFDGFADRQTTVSMAACCSTP
jgi:hypothetical protein